MRFGQRVFTLVSFFNFACAGAAILFSLTALSAGKEVHFKDVPIELNPGDRLVIIGLHGNIHLAPQPSTAKSGVMKVKKVIGDHTATEDQARFDSLTFVARRNGQTLIIEEKNSDSKTILGQALSPAGPELDFEIACAQVPTEISMRRGQVTVENWKERLLLNVVNGSVRTHGTEGSLQVQIQHGDVKIDNHRGRVEVDSFGAKLLLHDVDGDLDLTNFAGETSIKEASGAMDIRTQGGAVNVVKSSGSIDFLNGRGAFSLDTFEGPVRGQSDQGTVTANVEGEAEIHIDANQAIVNIKLPADSGASVRLASEEGALFAPASLNSMPHAKAIVGRLSGEGPKGTVAVKSKSGTVRLKI